MSPDPYRRSAKRRNPGSWNRYVYVKGDPVKYTDPSGLCAAMLAGITMEPGGAFGDLQKQLGAVAAYPYSSLGPIDSLASVTQQAVLGPNASTEVAVDAIKAALAGSTGLIDIIAYSGGAQALTTALNNSQTFSAADLARIGSVLYISPGLNGPVWTTINPANTTVITGTGPINWAIGLNLTIPSGVSTVTTNCAHTDLQCFFNAAQSQLQQIMKRDKCAFPKEYLLFPFLMAGPTNIAPGGAVGTASGDDDDDDDDDYDDDAAV